MAGHEILVQCHSQAGPLGDGNPAFFGLDFLFFYLFYNKNYIL